MCIREIHMNLTHEGAGCLGRRRAYRRCIENRIRAGNTPVAWLGGVADTIFIYGCERDEAALFRRVAPRFSLTVRMSETAVSVHNVDLARGSRCVSVDHKSRVSAPALRALRDVGVEYLSTRSAGCNHIDLDAAHRVGIQVEPVAYSPDSVADYTLMLMLMAARDARSIVTRAESGDFRLNPVRGRELRDMTVGVIGTGRIGSAVIDRLRGFGCRVLAHDRTPKTVATYVGLDDLLMCSDLVTLHTPLTAQTHHLLDAARIARLKPGAIVVNTGRGGLIDTAALAEALAEGTLGAVALDVVEGEEGIFYTDRASGRARASDRDRARASDRASGRARASDRDRAAAPLERLRQLPNALITPHTAYYTTHALRDVVQATIVNCREFERRSHVPGEDRLPSGGPGPREDRLPRGGLRPREDRRPVRRSR